MVCVDTAYQFEPEKFVGLLKKYSRKSFLLDEIGMAPEFMNPEIEEEDWNRRH